MSWFRYVPTTALDTVFGRLENGGMTSRECKGAADGPSDGERKPALETLRAGADHVRLSTGVFALRTDAVLRAREQHHVQAALCDLPTGKARDRRFVAALARLAGVPDAVRRAVGKGPLPALLLPAPGRHPLTIGRAPGSMLRLTHYTVSRSHARMRGTGDGWWLRDLGSSNGTWVNGGRVTSRVRVGPGDTVHFGDVGFRLEVPPEETAPADAKPRQIVDRVG